MRRLTMLFLTVLLLLAPTWAGAQVPVQIGVRLQNAAAATGNGATMDTSMMAVATFQTSGTFSATVTLEGSNDNTNWNSLTCYPLDSSGGGATMTTATIVRCNVLGIPIVRARVSTYSSGSVTVIASATSAQGSIRDSPSPTSFTGPVFSGGVRATQGTAPACVPTGGGTIIAGQGCTLVLGSDSAFTAKVDNGLPGGSTALQVTFNTAFATVPTCVGTWDGTLTYGYYLQAVTATTTTATFKIGGNAGGVTVTPPKPSFSPHDKIYGICIGSS